MDSIFGIGLILSAIFGFVASVLANRLDTPIGNAIDGASGTIRNWRQKRATKIERQIEILKRSPSNLIAYCSAQTIDLILFVVFLTFAMTESVLTGNILHELTGDKTSHAGVIAWRCISFASCTHEQFADRMYRNSIIYYTWIAIALLLTYCFVYFSLKFKHILKASTDLRDDDFE